MAAIGAGAALTTAAFVVTIILLGRRLVRDEARERVLRAILDNVSQGIMMVAPDRSVPICTRRAMEMLDIPPELIVSKPRFDDILRFQWERGEFGEDGASVDDGVRQFLLTGGISTEVHTYERRRPDGTVLEISTIPLVGGGLLRTFTDVTVAREREAALRAALVERDRAEAALPRQRDEMEREMSERARPLLASVARHRDMAEIASDWIWETDTDNCLTFVSKRFGETSGIPWAEVAGRAFGDLVALGFDPAGINRLLATIDARASFHEVVHRVVTAGNGTRFWRMSGKPFTAPATGTFAGYRGTGTDVTAAIEHQAALNGALLRAEAAEREARQASTRLVDAIEAIPEGFVLHDADDRLVLCNTRYAEIYNLPAEATKPGARFEDALWASANRGDLILPGRDITTVVAERLARHRAIGGNTEEYGLADGRWLRVVERPTSDGGIVGIQFDLTLQRQRETAERDREKLAALGHLAGGVAHEINNLMQPALTLPGLVRDRLPPDDTDSREDLDCVMESVRKVRDIVRNILLFARKEEPRLVPLDLAAEVRAALAFLRALMPPGVAIREVDFDACGGCCVAASKTQLTQVLTNLLVNAAQAMKGTGEVNVSMTRIDPTPKEAAALTVEPGRPYLAVSVADNGSGMDEATRARIFEPFFTTKPVGLGTGLGLSVAYGILRSWQGAITVKSAPGEGTTFVMYIPVLSPSEV